MMSELQIVLCQELAWHMLLGFRDVIRGNPPAIAECLIMGAAWRATLLCAAEVPS